jgi:hypothetical protein
LYSACLGAILYWRYWAKAYYWASMGVRQPLENTFLTGNSPLTRADVLQKKTHFHDVSLEQYKELRDAPYYGTYGFGLTPVPVFTVNDLDLVKNIFSKFGRKS